MRKCAVQKDGEEQMKNRQGYKRGWLHVKGGRGSLSGGHSLSYLFTKFFPNYLSA